MSNGQVGREDEGKRWRENSDETEMINGYTECARGIKCMTEKNTGNE